MKRLEKDYRVSKVANTLNVNRSSFYKWKRRPLTKRQREDNELGEIIKSIFYNSGGTYGTPRILNALKNRGIKCGNNRVNRILRTLNLTAKAAKKFKVTTDSNHSL